MASLHNGKKNSIIDGHSSVNFFFTQPDLNTRQAIWLAFLSEFDFEVRHIKGKENKVVDALSRRVHGLLEINISREESDLEQTIRMKGINDENYTKIMTELQNSTATSNKPDPSIDKKGLLRFKNKFYIPDSTM